MKLVDQTKDRVTNFFTAPLSEMSRWGRFTRGQFYLWRFCVKRLRANNAMAMSAALAFRTVFALVPIMIVGFLVFNALGFVNERKELLERFLEDSGWADIEVPADQGRGGRSRATGGPVTSAPARRPAPRAPGGQIASDAESTEATSRPVTTRPGRRRGGRRGPTSVGSWVRRIIRNAEGELTLGSLGPLGAVLLIWTALTLLTTIERSLNRVFEAPRPRSIARRTLVYWSAMTLGPLILSAVIYAGGKVTEAVQDVPVVSWLVAGISWTIPALLGVAFLGAIYTLMPNVRVRFKLALVGATVTMVVFLVMRWGFGLYAVHVVTKQSYYGAVVMLPLFLLWLLLSWWTFLFGAEIVHTLGHASEVGLEDLKETAVLSQWHMLGGVVAVAMKQAAGDQPVSIGQIARAIRLPIRSTEELLNRLADAGLVCQVADDRTVSYVTLKVPLKVTVGEIFRAGEGRDDRAGATDRWDPAVAAVVDRVRHRMRNEVEPIHVSDLLEQFGGEDESPAAESTDPTPSV